MSRLLFTARCVDWTCHPLFEDEAGDSIGESRYRVYDDGTVEQGVWSEPLKPEAFERLMELLNGDFRSASTHHDALDGEGWAMTLYDGDGGILHETELGYVYGVPVLEEIAAILRAPKSWETPGVPDGFPDPDELMRQVLQDCALEQKKRKEAERKRNRGAPGIVSPDGFPADAQAGSLPVEILRIAEKDARSVASLLADFRRTLNSYKGILSGPDILSAEEEVLHFIRSGYPVYAATVGDLHVGYIVCRIEDSVLWVEHIYVSPAYRRRGVATLLFEKAEGIARSLGEDTVYNYVHPNNDGMIGFLRSKGYTVLNLIEIRKPYKGEKLNTTVRVNDHPFDY